MFKINSPLKVTVGFNKKKQKNVEFLLNLNNFRNTFYRVLNNAKVQYKIDIQGQLEGVEKLKRCVMVYTVFKGDNRRFDIGNIASIHQKFFEDAFVEYGYLPDDKYTNIPMVVYRFGGISKDNPRVEIEVFNLDDEYEVKRFKDLTKETIDTFHKERKRKK